LINVALGAYHRAAELDTLDYRPLWNISAVHYELGSYDLASEYAHRALGLVPPNEDAASQKILLRLAKAHLHLKQYDEAATYITDINAGPDRNQLQDALKIGTQATDARKKSQAGNGRSVRNLPQYKPQAHNVPEYYTVGHDNANSMYDMLLDLNSSDTEALAFLFAGIGDSRHLLQTFITIARFELALPTHRKYRFTINDVKQEVFARDLIFFLLLDQLAPEIERPDQGSTKVSKKGWQEIWTSDAGPMEVSEKGEKTLTTLFYAYISQVMPPAVYEDLKLQSSSPSRLYRARRYCPHGSR
jgi:tetratricopeptide (TPR) repeat protein